MNPSPSPSRSRRSAAQQFLFLTSVMLFAGCASFSSDLRARADADFRKQNELSDQFMFMEATRETDDPAHYQALFTAEEKMLGACEALNDLALKRRDNRRITFREKRHIPGMLSACESASAEFAQLLLGEVR